MSRTISDTYPLYDAAYGGDIPVEQYFVILFDALPSKQADALYYDPKIKDYFISVGFTEITKTQQFNRRYDLAHNSLLLNKEKNLIVYMSGGVDKKKDNLFQIVLYYNLSLGLLEEQYSLDDIKKFERKKKKSSINLVKSDMGHLDIEDYDLFVPPMNLELNYGKDFVKVFHTIEKRLNEPNGKGIILLHGEPGSGKTSLIKHLTSVVKDKEILFIPPSMAEMLSEPSIIPFLMEHKNSILIIEDAERVIGDRETSGSPAGVSNILNLTDGILGDCLSIQIVATFNMKREKIDQALLRKGRLIAEHKFDKLTVDETNKLLKHLNKNHIVEDGMVLADIYNIDVEVHKTQNKTNKIGF
jgi:energy-coupling factor transporter ATP-binding protein EcfA2